MELLKKLKTNVIISSILCIVIGIVLVIWPDLTMEIACLAIGAVLLIAGITRLITYFTARDGSLYSQINLIFGIVLIVVGALILWQWDKVLEIVPIIVGIIIAIHGISDLRQAFALRKNEYEKWWVALILGLLTVILGVLLILNPFAALDTVVMLIGIFLIFDGISVIWITSRIYRTAKAMEQEAGALDVEIEVQEVQVTKEAGEVKND